MKVQERTVIQLLLLLAVRNTSRNTINGAWAFQSELISQAILSLDASSFSSSPDEILFAAVNLLDTQQTRPFPPLLLPARTSSTASPTYRTYDDEYQYDYDLQPLSRTISLTKQEENLFQLVRDVRDIHFPNTTLRIAGGWVRDKLLRKPTPSRDIDFVLNDTSGSEFAKLFHEYLIEQQQNGLNIRLNPAIKNYGTRSKHLQSASLQVGGFSIDFCHLRFEKYSRDSRVPKATGIASAVEDAWRRDLTINSLFYNINTNQVEDWTEQGLQDLSLRNIATPMAPLFTFLEDPLRILRAIRFAAQLSFSMDPALKKAALDKRVRHALQRKVSNVRMGNEIDSVFQTCDPARGIELLMETNLVDLVFPLHDKQLLEASPLAIYQAGFHLLSRTQALVSRIFTRAEQWDESKRRFLWYAAFFKPFCDMSSSSSLGSGEGGKRRRHDGSILYQLLHGLKRPTCEIQSIESIILGADALWTFLKKHDDFVKQSLFESGIRFDTISKHDPQCKQIADLRVIFYKVLKQIGPLWKESLILMLASSQKELSEAVQQYLQWVALIEDGLGLDDARFNLKPLLNGSQIQKRALPGVRGEGFKQVMQAQEEWQVRHYFSGAPSANKNIQEAALIDYLMQTFPEYTRHHV